MNTKNKILEKINKNRQTTKRYSDQKISAENWNDILATLYWAPSSHGFEPYRVLVIEKGSKHRSSLKPMMWNQVTIDEADKLVMFISLRKEAFINEDWIFERSLRRATEIIGLTGKEAEEGAKKQTELVYNTHLLAQENSDHWAMKQTYIALGQMMSAATILDINSQAVEGFIRKDIDKYLKDEKLIKENETTALAMTFGYAKDRTSFAHSGDNRRVRDSQEYKITTIK